MAVVVSRTADEALCLNEVSQEELRAIGSEEQDLLCIQPENHALYRIRKESGRRPAVRTYGLVVEASIVDSRCEAKQPTGVHRFHFCRSLPCKAAFNGLNAPVPYAHLVCLRATPQDQEVDLSLYAPSTQPALAATPVAEQIKRYAEYVRSPFRFVGIYTFLAFAVQQRREVRIWFTMDHYVDIVDSYARWNKSNMLETNTSSGNGKRFNVLACVVERVEENVRSIRMLRSIEEVGRVNHYLPLIDRGTHTRQTPAHPPCNGMLCSKLGDACMAQVTADVSTLGMFPVRSVTDGDCSFDTMLFLENAARTTTARRAKRVLLSQYALERKDDPNWRSSWIACGESAPESPVSTPAPGSAPASASTKPAPAATLDSLSGIALCPPCSSAGVSPAAPVAQTPSVQVASVSASSSSSGTCASATTAAAVPAKPEATTQPALAATPVAAVPAKQEATTVAAVPATPEVLAAAIMAFVGQKRISPAETRKIAAGLSQEETNYLLKEYAEHMAAEAKETSTRKVLHPLLRHDRDVEQKNRDAEHVAAFAARRGVDPRGKTVPRNFWRSFFLETYGEARMKNQSAREKAALRMYWKRRLRMNGFQESVRYTKGIRCGARAQARPRLRRLGKQGRPVMAVGIEEGLLSWFVELRRRGVRVGPRAFRKKSPSAASSTRSSSNTKRNQSESAQLLVWLLS